MKKHHKTHQDQNEYLGKVNHLGHVIYEKNAEFHADSDGRTG